MKKTSIVITIIISLLFSIFPINDIIAEESVTVTFDGNGGLFDDQEILTIQTDDSNRIIEDNWPNNPSRFGYVFSGFLL